MGRMSFGAPISPSGENHNLLTNTVLRAGGGVRPCWRQPTPKKDSNDEVHRLRKFGFGVLASAEVSKRNATG